MSRPYLQICLAALLVGLWLAFLFVGWAWGGAVHVLLVAALVVFPWKAVARTGSP